MTSGVSVSSAWAEAASASNSFSWTDALVIFVVVIVGAAGDRGAGRPANPAAGQPSPAADHAQPAGAAGRRRGRRGDRAGRPALRPSGARGPPPRGRGRRPLGPIQLAASRPQRRPVVPRPPVRDAVSRASRPGRLARAPRAGSARGATPASRSRSAPAGCRPRCPRWRPRTGPWWMRRRPAGTPRRARTSRPGRGVAGRGGACRAAAGRADPERDHPVARPGPAAGRPRRSGWGSDSTGRRGAVEGPLLPDLAGLRIEADTATRPG